MGETILDFLRPIAAPNGIKYEARICGSQMEDAMWQGWIELVPIGGGKPVRTGRETTQPNRYDLVYWATGLTEVYLEGALRRALEGPVLIPPVERSRPSLFPGPAPSTIVSSPQRNGYANGVAPGPAIMDPFSVYEKSGEEILRRQLGALSHRHLVNIALEYELTDCGVQRLGELRQPELIELIVGTVREEAERPRPA